MKKNKLLIAVSIILLSFTNCFALDLSEVCSQLASHPVTKGSFTQVKSVNSAKGKRELKSSGTFILCPDGILWNTEKPFPSQMSITKARIVQTSSDGRQSVIEGKDNQMFESIASTVTAVFSNNLEEINRVFKAELSTGDAGKWELSLFPKDSTIASAMEKIILAGTSRNGSTSLDSMIIQESSDSVITYSFTDQSYFKELTSDEKAIFAL